MTRLTAGIDPAKLVRQGLEDLQNESIKVGRLRLYRAAQRMRSRLAIPGSKVVYPIPWDSEKQKRAFFATNGFGRGIPYQRTDKTSKAWRIIPVPGGYRLVNRKSSAKWVYGNAYGLRQSRIHQGRWPVFRNVVDEEIAKLPEEVVNELRLVARRKAKPA